MAEKTFTINGSEYIFINRFRGNRSGFVHETDLIRNGWTFGTHKIQYYNRTWERYEYQSVMKGCVHKLMESEKEDYIQHWKAAHGCKRLTAEKRKAMEEDFENNTPVLYAELKELYSML